MTEIEKLMRAGATQDSLIKDFYAKLAAAEQHIKDEEEAKRKAAEEAKRMAEEKAKRLAAEKAKVEAEKKAAVEKIKAKKENKAQKDLDLQMSRADFVDALLIYLDNLGIIKYNDIEDDELYQLYNDVEQLEKGRWFHWFLS